MKFAHAAAATLAALASIAATAAPAPGPDVPLIPRASIFGNPTKAQGLISPDGKWISWLAPRDGVLNIWVAPANDPAKATPLTSEKVRPIRQHFWTLDSKQILFINDHGGDE
ncbi:MAG TPA: S9 family peptidase, partial [Usitatibacter sp.]|nr:S9 family peptidase [Usitatibacter sp.]